jgi:branched-chain amino acid transport system substrate-binding protein
MDDLMWARGPIGGPFALIDHTGKVRTDVDFRGKLSAYLFEVKKPEESKYPGDFFKTRATIPAAEAFRPLKDGGCPLVSG